MCGYWSTDKKGIRKGKTTRDPNRYWFRAVRLCEQAYPLGTSDFVAQMSGIKILKGDENPIFLLGEYFLAITFWAHILLGSYVHFWNQYVKTDFFISHSMYSKKKSFHLLKGTKTGQWSFLKT